MKKQLFLAITVLAAFSLSSCQKTVAHEGGVNNDTIVKEGRIWTHTKNSHVVQQQLTPEEKELAKDHITYETSFGTSNASIDSVGAKMVNDYRKGITCEK